MEKLKQFNFFKMYEPHVIYWSKTKNNKKKFFHAKARCFSDVRNGIKNVEKIYFKCEIDKSLTKNEINFYLKFCKDVIPPGFGKLFSARLLRADKLGEKILFVLDCKKISRFQQLVFLTLFRYLQEFPEIVKDFYQNKSKAKKCARVQEDFISFQESHKNFYKNESIKYYNIDGHGVIYKYGGRAFNKELNSFYEKFIIGQSRGVQDYFN